jgi:hypothetical protein
MLWSKKTIFPSKFNVKLQKKIWEKKNSGGGRDLGQGGYDFFSGGGGVNTLSTPCGHVCMYTICPRARARFLSTPYPHIKPNPTIWGLETLDSKLLLLLASFSGR